MKLYIFEDGKEMIAYFLSNGSFLLNVIPENLDFGPHCFENLVTDSIDNGYSKSYYSYKLIDTKGRIVN